MELASLAGLGFAVFLCASLLIAGIAAVLGGERALARELVQDHATSSGAVRSIRGSDDLLKQRKSISGVDSLDALLSRSSLIDKIALELMQGDVSMRVGEYMLGRLVLAVVLGGGVYLWNGPLLVIPFVLLGFYLPKIWVARRKASRTKALHGQLVDALSILANNLRVGYGITQALESAAKELRDPMAAELSRIVRDVNLGVDSDAAFIAFMERAGSYDVELMVSAILIQRQTGGNLSEILDNVAHTIRERVRVKGEIRTLTADARISAVFLSAIPLGMIVLLQLINPGYIGGMWDHPIGRLMLIGGAGMLIVGWIILRRMSDIKM